MQFNLRTYLCKHKWVSVPVDPFWTYCKHLCCLTPHLKLVWSPWCSTGFDFLLSTCQTKSKPKDCHSTRRGVELILIRMDGVPLRPSQEDSSCTLGLALSPAQGGDGGSRCGESVNAWCVGGCGRTFPCLSLFLWQDQEPLRGGHPLWHQRGLATLGSWACELPQVIRERLEKTVTRKEISREGRSNKALNNSPSVESHWGHRPRD